MSTQSVRTAFDGCLPAFEAMEPRLLLSVARVAITPFDGVLPEVALNIDFEVPRQTHDSDTSLISENLSGFRDSIAALVAADPDADAGALSDFFRRATADGRIQISVSVTALTSDVLAALAASGMEIEVTVAWIGAVQGWTPYDSLETMAGIEGVTKLDLPEYGITRTGSITSAGDGILNADDLRAAFPEGIDGTGVNIGVISDGIRNWDKARDTGDLPSTLTYSSLGELNKNEGTAMLEIVHDLAPGAELYFAPGGTVNDFLAALDWLDDRVDIIVDDIGFLSQPYFTDGSVASAVGDVVDAGLVYVSAAGNDAIAHFQGDFDPDQYDCQSWPSGGNVLPYLAYGDPEDTTYFTVAVQWSDEWGDSGNDYSLHAFFWDEHEEDWVYISSSDYVQTGIGCDPYETIHLQNPTHDEVTFGFVFARDSGSSREIELFVSGPGHFLFQDDMVSSDSIFGHAAVEEAIAVGAIGAHDGPEYDDIEVFSSRGPSTIYTDFDNQIPTTRHPLDVAGIDRVSTSIGDQHYFDEPFSGTSAAAPHIAGIAALLKEIDPDLTPAQIEDLICANAVDLGDTGYDDVFGFGRADALATVSATPTEVNLLPAYDTGESNQDNITYRDNSDAGKTLQFDVLGTVAGATVTLYAGVTEIASEAATGTTTTVTTDGEEDLADGVREITARQTEPGKLPSAASDGLDVTIDTVAPTVVTFERSGRPHEGQEDDPWEWRPLELHKISITFSEDMSTIDSSALTLYNLSTEETIDLTDVEFAYDSETKTATWDFSEVAIDDAGWYQVTLSAEDVEDVAGNALDGDGNGTGGDDYVYGDDAGTEEVLLIPILGDITLDGSVDSTDLTKLLASYNQETWEEVAWSWGDFNYDWVVNSTDLTKLLASLNTSLPR